LRIQNLIHATILTQPDLLGVPDHVVWNYGKRLRALAKARKYHSVEFARLTDLLDTEPCEGELDDMSYAAVASTMRLKLMNRYGAAGYGNEKSEFALKDNANKHLTYRGYLKFLELDLLSTYPIGLDRTKSRFKRGVEKIAKCMLRRGDAFARAVSERFPNHVRLSIHPSTGEDKISINILPVSQTLTPWHNSIAFKVDGTVLAGNRSLYEEMEDMELVYAEGQPSYYREKSYLYDWGGTKVVIEPLNPSGLVIRPANGPNSLNIDDINVLRVRGLAEQNSPVVLRGFAGSKDRERFVAAAYQLGQPTPWKFGLVLEVKDCGADGQGLNNVLSGEWMPFHFDGMFKTQKKLDDDGKECLIPGPPRFQFFTAVTPSPPDTGYTLFSTSRLVIKHLPQDLPLEVLETLTWAVSTPSFDTSTIKNMPLVTFHPSTAKPCLRYHERWPQEKTRFEPTAVEIENGTEKTCNVLESLLHDPRVCYWHEWEEGDMLVNDNISTLHTRSSFTAKSERELWRIHFD
jgi:alpha-ketoglutarate-dependent taurine dioxygenase